MKDYIVAMLRDPVDGSPSSSRHCGVALVIASIVVAILSVCLRHDASTTVGALAGGGAFQMFARTKASGGES